jgi:4-diphosphocytidyl-2-C-methyl-D-erythritol kinase
MYLRRNGPIVEVDAPAKLNLFLEVLAQREDGFHEIETLMAAITIFDTLSLETHTEGRIRLACRWCCGASARRNSAALGGDESSWGDLPEEADNIVYRAVARLRERAGVKCGATIRLVKRIPSAAGLGGASSDAAAALVAANEAWRLGWSRDQLEGLGAELGSDVPFFLRPPATAAICRGRGEEIEPLNSRGVLHFVVVKPPGGLSTADVYRQCRPADRRVDIQPLTSAWRRGEAGTIARLLWNRLEQPAEQLSPWIRRTRQLLDRLDCLGGRMSGSGTSWFGVCRNARHARRVAGRLRAAGAGIVLTARTAAQRN